MAKILIIDDDQDILRLLDFTLKRAGHQITAAVDGVQGLAQVKASKPDLIVADVMMPKMTGYEFCRQVRAKPEMADTPIIIFSARFQPIDKQTALEAGATDYLPKSTSPDALIKRIAELLPAGQAAAAPAVNTVVGFFSLRGGSGVSSLAANTAVALAVSRQTRVALVDLTPVGGHAALLLGLRPASSLLNALASAKKPDIAALSPHFIAHSSGVQLLASALSYEHQPNLKINQLEDLTNALRPHFAFTVLDMSRLSLETHTAALWQQLDKVVLVLSPDMPALQSAAMASQGLAWLGVPPDKILLVVNQTITQNALSLETIKTAVKRPITTIIPFEPDMVKAINSGQPFLLSSPKSGGAAAIARLSKAVSN